MKCQCGAVSFAWGFCSRHYQQWKRYGSPRFELDPAPCPGCGRKRKPSARGHCNTCAEELFAAENAKAAERRAQEVKTGIDCWSQPKEGWTP